MKSSSNDGEQGEVVMVVNSSAKARQRQHQHTHTPEQAGTIGRRQREPKTIAAPEKRSRGGENGGTEMPED